MHAQACEIIFFRSCRQIGSWLAGRPAVCSAGVEDTVIPQQCLDGSSEFDSIPAIGGQTVTLDDSIHPDPGGNLLHSPCPRSSETGAETQGAGGWDKAGAVHVRARAKMPTSTTRCRAHASPPSPEWLSDRQLFHVSLRELNNNCTTSQATKPTRPTMQSCTAHVVARTCKEN